MLLERLRVLARRERGMRKGPTPQQAHALSQGHCLYAPLSTCSGPPRQVGLRNREDENVVLARKGHTGALWHLDERHLAELERHLVRAFTLGRRRGSRKTFLLSQRQEEDQPRLHPHPSATSPVRRASSFRTHLGGADPQTLSLLNPHAPIHSNIVAPGGRPRDSRHTHRPEVSATNARGHSVFLNGAPDAAPSQKIPPREKKCVKRGEVKESRAFRRARRDRDGLSSWCAECHNAANRRHRRKRRVEALLEEAAAYERDAAAGGLLARSSRTAAETTGSRRAQRRSRAC
jgi:hypothetical protein